jgi:hypothetical protein
MKESTDRAEAETKSAPVRAVYLGETYLMPRDWRVASQYPNSASKNFKRWAWEFLRRNPDYGALTQKAQSLPPEALSRTRRPHDNDLIAHFVVTPEPHKFFRGETTENGALAIETILTVRDYREWCDAKGVIGHVLTWREHLRYEWGVSYPLAPSEHFYKKNAVGQKTAKIRFLSVSFSYVAPDSIDLNTAFDPLAVKSVRVSMRSNEMWVRIRLSDSLTPQLDRMRASLERWQERYISRLDKKCRLPATGQQPEKLTRIAKKEKRETVSAQTLHYALRVYDAVHLHPQYSVPLDDERIKKIVAHFKHEVNDVFKFKAPHKIPVRYHYPVFRAEQIRKWYEHAKEYVHHHGYLRIAAHKSGVTNEKKAEIAGDRKID